MDKLVCLFLLITTSIFSVEYTTLFDAIDRQDSSAIIEYFDLETAPQTPSFTAGIRRKINFSKQVASIKRFSISNIQCMSYKA